MRVWLAAVAFILACATAQGQDADALIARGDALNAKFRTKEALAVFLEADKLQPNNPEILQRVAREYGLSMNDVSSRDEKRAFGEKALGYARQAVAADAGNANAQLALSISYGRLAELSDNKTKIAYSKLVKEHADIAAKLNPSNDLAFYILGEWNYGMSNLNPIVRAIAKAVYGDLPPASNADAIRYFQKAVELNPNRIGTRVGLGRAYAAAGDKASARKELEKALSLPNKEKDDDFAKARAREALARL